MITGLLAATDDGTNVANYGGITRDTSEVGTSVKSNYDGTGGVISHTLLGTQYGKAIIGNEKPDLLITTQTIWDALEARSQPQQRYGSEDMVKAGFDVFRFRSADVVVDSHCPSGYIFGLNTDYLKLVLHKDRVPAEFTGWKQTANQDVRIGQLLMMAEMVCSSPRLQFQMRNVTA